MNEATPEEDFLVGYPVGAVWTTDVSLLLPRKMVHPYCIMLPQGGCRVVQEQAPLTSVAVAGCLEKQASLVARSFSILQWHVCGTDLLASL